MELTFANIAIIVAASQSFLLSLLVFQKHRAIFANRFLAALMFTYTVILLHLIFQDAGTYKAMPLIFLIVGAPLAASPLHYLYTKYLLDRTETFMRNDWIHFLPVILFELVLIVSIVIGALDFPGVAVTQPEDVTPFFRLFGWLLIVQGLSYMLAALRLIVRYNSRLKDVVSSVEQIQMNWLRNITIAGLCAWFLYLLEDSLMMNGINLSNFILVSVVFAVYVYAMGYTGLVKSEIFAAPGIGQAMHDISSLAGKTPVNDAVKYEKSGLSEETAQRYVQQLLHIMEEKKPHIDPSLTLSQLAGMLGISTHNLSEVINTKLKKNFYDFINGYRLEQVKKDLADPTKQHLKILSIAFDAGFNSKASFNAIFKEGTGLTPSRFRQKI